MMLVVLWILFSVLHSVLASVWWKNKINRILGKSFRFYRFYYSIFATANLTGILYFQFTIESPILWKSSVLFEFFAWVTCIAGLSIMLACMRKYFNSVTGINSFSRNKSGSRVLETEGLHRYTRHPLYLGTLIFIWGFFLLVPNWSNLITCCLVSIYTVAGIFIEEQKLVMEFGECYTTYARKVPMLIPRFFLRRGPIHQSFHETA